MIKFKNEKLSIFLLLLVLSFLLISCGKKDEVIKNQNLEISQDIVNKSNQEEKEDKNLEDTNKDQEEKEKVTKSIYPYKIKDEYGREVEFLEKPKIISLAPFITEILYAIGGEDQLIGVTSFCDYPEAAKEKEVVSGFAGADFEKILSLEPDLILLEAFGKEDELEFFKENNIKVLGLKADNIDDILYNIKIVGNIIDQPIKGEEEVERVKENIKKVQESIGLVDRKPSLVFEVWSNPIMLAGKDTFIGQVIELAGGNNLVEGDDYTVMTLDEVIDKNPDYYIVPDDGTVSLKAILERPGFRDISAIEKGQVYIIDGDIISRPGPRIDQAIKLIAEIIHKDILK